MSYPQMGSSHRDSLGRAERPAEGCGVLPRLFLSEPHFFRADFPSPVPCPRDISGSRNAIFTQIGDTLHLEFQIPIIFCDCVSPEMFLHQLEK